MAHHYDPRYAKSAARHSTDQQIALPDLSEKTLATTARRLIATAGAAG